MKGTPREKQVGHNVDEQPLSQIEFPGEALFA